MEKVQVKFKVHFSYNPEDANPCEAKLTVFLPAMRVGYEVRLNRVLRSAETEVFGEKLGVWWGERCEEGGTVYRVRSHCLFASSWEELRDLVEREIESVIDKLRSAKERNLEMENSKPGDLEVVYEI